MTTPSGQISISNVNTEVGLSATNASSMQYLNSLLRSNERPSSPNMDAFRNKNWFRRNVDGNCNNGNQGNCNCNCGNINCTNCTNCNAINCANCDGQNYLQSNCNCACTYNCNVNSVSYNCDCNCACDCG